ncbi:MAG: GNAT family N-acetyltransferase [Oscillospiraceae bacterium]|nr:GNAT family N-acetyltransferase [Oscillospiraceae bacterium]
MNFIKLLELNELKSIYKDHIRRDFPRGERRPLFAMKRLQRAGRYNCYGYYRDNDLAAYACYVLAQNDSYALLDYFAVVPALRGHGIGSAFLQDLQKTVSAKYGVFIEAESPCSAKSEQEKSLRERRIRFYLSNGAEMTDSKCLLFGVDYDILFTPATNTDRGAEARERRHALDEFYRELYGRAYDRLCKPYYEHGTKYNESGRESNDEIL